MSREKARRRRPSDRVLTMHAAERKAQEARGDRDWTWRLYRDERAPRFEPK